MDKKSVLAILLHGLLGEMVSCQRRRLKTNLLLRSAILYTNEVDLKSNISDE